MFENLGFFEIQVFDIHYRWISKTRIYKSWRKKIHDIRDIREIRVFNLARLTYFSYSISSPIRRISFQKSFQKNNGRILVRVPHRVPHMGPHGGYPRFYNYPHWPILPCLSDPRKHTKHRFDYSFHSFWLVFYGGPQFLARGISCR